MVQIIVATGNEGKLREFREILQGLPLSISSLRDHWNPVPDIPETGNTFVENARLKADWVFERSKGVWALADDSGLEVDALGGKPGVWSARYAGKSANADANNRKLLEVMALVALSDRTARFRCALVLKTGHQVYLFAEGVCEGRIGFEERGSGGFGYDPLFIPDGYELSFAEIGPAEKHRISHRGKALKHLREQLYGIVA